MQDIEVIDMRTVTTGCAKNFTTFLKSLNLIALRLPLPPFYFPKQTFYLSICNPPFKCWTPPKLKFRFNVLRKLSLLLHPKVFLFTRNFDQCFRLIKKLTSISTKRIKPFLTQHNHFCCVFTDHVLFSCWWSKLILHSAIIYSAELLPKVPLPFIWLFLRWFSLVNVYTHGFIWNLKILRVFFQFLHLSSATVHQPCSAKTLVRVFCLLCKIVADPFLKSSWESLKVQAH